MDFWAKINKILTSGFNIDDVEENNILNSKDRFFDEYPFGKCNWIKETIEKYLHDNDKQQGVIYHLIKEKYTEEVKNNLVKFESKYSNDISNEFIIDFLASGQKDEPIKEFIENIWVGKIEGKGVDGNNAAAHFNISGVKGNLITICSFLEISINAIASVYASQLIDVYKILDNLVVESEAISKVKTSILTQKSIQGLVDTKSSEELYLFLEKLTDPEKAKYREIVGNCSKFSKQFIVSHEIGHHYLGHTDSGLPFSSFKANDSVLKNEERQREELEADKFAIDLMFSSGENFRNGNQYSVEYLSGPLIGIIVMALGDKDPSLEGKEYPSVKDRLINIIESMIVYDVKLMDIAYELFDRILTLINKVHSYWKTNWWPNPNSISGITK
ncbi:ImmA/IrrE family metallo-endopeptidase [Bacillus sp. SM-B1]|uniref:ImmA/IrrE family metallo-endopeptidase n=1 Tax=Bacillus sp. SM-B1 TaxID=2980102 RepID=UPI00294A4079|nr:ImmA/IrrE family metallo-endopeptidase [Bacillus sp. SM-B1]MDV6039287.1 ImmA/IrrE family metallo-endopeptidase [Bacillus sp. SM-B1]